MYFIEIFDLILFFLLFFLKCRFEKCIFCKRISSISEVSALPCNREPAPSEQSSVPISFMTSGVVNKVPWAWPRCCYFLLVNISSIHSGSLIIFHWVALDFGMLFQSVKSLVTSICWSSDFRLGVIWKLIDAWVYFICSIVMSYLIAFSLGHFPSSYCAIERSWR